MFNDFSLEILDEEVTPSDIDTSSLELKDKLNPVIWVPDSGFYRMNTNVMRFLIQVGMEFYNYCIKNIDRTISIDDMVVTGSMCNYNWSEYSDIDIHVIVDYSKYPGSHELVADYLMDKKRLFKNKKTYKLAGYDIEFYAQDNNELHIKDSGVYSLINGGWIQKPNREKIPLDLDKVREKASDLMNQIDESLDDKKSLEEISKRLRKMRQTALDEFGEFAPENLAYKVLRRTGYLAKIKQI